MVIVFTLLLIIIFIYQIVQVIDAINNGKFLLGFIKIPLNDINIVLELIEQANSGAYITANLRNTPEVLRIKKGQNDLQWWFEVSISSRNKSRSASIIQTTGIGTDFTNTSNFEDKSIVEHDKYKILNFVSKYFYEIYHCDEKTIVTVKFKKTLIDNSFQNNYSNTIQFLRG